MSFEGQGSGGMRRGWLRSYISKNKDSFRRSAPAASALVNLFSIGADRPLLEFVLPGCTDS